MTPKTRLCLWLVLLATCNSSFIPKNLALRGIVTQSNLINNPHSGYGDARNAIDGNRNPNFEEGSCSHTDAHTNPWWRVDLLDSYIITSIIITNRRDCCPERLNGAEVRIGNSLLNNGADNALVQTIPSIGGGESRTLKFDKGFEGRYVIVSLPGKSRILTLCEVEVYGYLAPTGNNVATSGTATQSSTYNYQYAYSVIDGNPNPIAQKSSCSHTFTEVNPWWRLDLLKTYKVFSVAITNRGDCCSERLNGAEIRIGDSRVNNGNNNARCALISFIPPGATQIYKCSGMDGRYVNVVIPGEKKTLTLCEVEVYGSPLE